MRTLLLPKIFTLVLFLMSFFVTAQITVSGKVNFKNKGVKDISVTLKDTYDGSTTDENGNFFFQTSEKGKQILVFSILNLWKLKNLCYLKTMQSLSMQN